MAASGSIINPPSAGTKTPAEDKATAEQKKQELVNRFTAAVSRQYHMAQKWSDVRGEQAEEHRPVTLYPYGETALNKELETVRKNVGESKLSVENKKTVNSYLDSINKTMQGHFTRWLEYSDKPSFDEKKWNVDFNEKMKPLADLGESLKKDPKNAAQIEELKNIAGQLGEIRDRKVFEQLNQTRKSLEDRSHDLQWDINQQWSDKDKTREWKRVLGEAEQTMKVGQSTIFGASQNKTKPSSLEGIWERPDKTSILGSKVSLFLQVSRDGKIMSASPLPTDQASLERFWRAKFDFIKEQAGSNEVVLTIDPKSRAFFGREQFDMLLNLAEKREMVIYTSDDKNPNFPGLGAMIEHLSEGDQRHVINRFKNLLANHQKQESSLADSTKQALKEEAKQEIKDCEEKVDQNIAKIDRVAETDQPNKFWMRQAQVDEAQHELIGQLNKIDDRMKRSPNDESLKPRQQKLDVLQEKIGSELKGLRTEVDNWKNLWKEHEQHEKKETGWIETFMNKLGISTGLDAKDAKYEDKETLVNTQIANREVGLKKLEADHETLGKRLEVLKQQLGSAGLKQPSAPDDQSHAVIASKPTLTKR